MQLKNKQDGNIYWVRTETDIYEGFMLHASGSGEAFFMHYRSLKGFMEEWEDLDE